MDKLLYFFARAVIAVLQALPLNIVARIGRLGGAIFYWLDARHRQVALKNLHLCFGEEKSETELRHIAQENFKRIGEGYCCAAKTASMTFEQLRERLEFVHAENFSAKPDDASGNRVVAIGHFGNFEIYARFGHFLPHYQAATTYRGVRPPSLDRLLKSLREKSGCLFFERRTDAEALKSALTRGGLILGLLVDQHAGHSGVRIPFFGHDCSTSAAPAILALRYHCPLNTGICYRVALARWRLEASDEIPTHENGAARSSEAIMSDVNRAFEIAVRRDPANWFWVHNRWKPRAKNQNESPVKTDEAKVGR